MTGHLSEVKRWLGGLLRWKPGENAPITRRERWQALVLSLPGVYLSCRFWLQDAIDPLTASALLVDRALQILILLILPAAVFLVAAKPPLALRAGVILAGSCTILGIALFVTAVIRPPTDQVIALLAAVTTAGSAIPLCKLGRRDKVLRTAPAKAAAAAFAIALPLVQFWNGVAFLPSQVEAAYQEEITFDTVADDDGGATTVVRLLARNDTDARLLILRTRLTACWWGDEQAPKYRPEELEDLTNCQHSFPLSELSWIPPQSSLSWSTTVRTPPGDHRLVVISRVRFARGDRLRVREPEVSEGALDGCQFARVFRVEEESRLKGLAQQDKFLVYADEDGDGGFHVRFQVGGDVTCPGTEADLTTYFGLTEFTGVNEARLEDPPVTEPN